MFGWQVGCEAYLKRSCGLLQAQLVTDECEPEEAERRALQAQYGVLAALRRLLILHASKLLAVVVFAAAIQHRSAFGWLLVGK